MFCKICKTLSLKFMFCSLRTSYATLQSKRLVGIGKTLAMSQPAHSNLNPLSSIFSLMCTLGRSSMLVCWERWRAASHAPRSESVSGKIEYWVQQRESMRERVYSFIKIKNSSFIVYAYSYLLVGATSRY
jgi:hypothetical protein